MRRIWAFARLTVLAAIRQKIMLFQSLIILAVGVLVPLALKSDGTVVGGVKVVINYTLGISFLILAITTVWFSCSVLVRDFEERQIDIAVTKPVHRWEIWIGKWIGILLCNTFLLLIIGLVTLAGVGYSSAKLLRNGSERDVEKLRQELLVGRTGVKPPQKDIEPMVEKVFQERRKKGELDPRMSDERARYYIRRNLRDTADSIGLQESHQWKIEGIKPRSPDDIIQVKFQYLLTKPLPTQRRLQLNLVFGDEDSRVIRLQMLTLPEVDYEIPVPASVLKDETLYFTIEHADTLDTTVLVPMDNGLEVFYESSTFGLNLTKALFLAWLRLAFVAAVGLCLTSVFSFPVAVVVALTTLLLCVSNHFFLGVVNTPGIVFDGGGGDGHEGEEEKEGWIAENLKKFTDYGIRRMISILITLVPDFGKLDGISSLVQGREISWKQIAQAVGSQFLFEPRGWKRFETYMPGRCLLVILLGIYLLQRREIARPT